MPDELYKYSPDQTEKIILCRMDYINTDRAKQKKLDELIVRLF